MDKLLTVAVPTYNAEKYLRDNLESFLVQQILDDIEILIINDGSTDGSLDIAMEYVRQYPATFHVITKENGGHGSGINYGIKFAKGKYFKVVDADDWVDGKAFCELVEILRTCNSDIVYSGFYWVYDNGQLNKDDFKKKAEMREPFKGVIYQKEYLFDEIADKIYVKMHNMTIRTELLQTRHIVIDEHCFYVDTEYIVFPIPHVNTISFVDAFVYMYRIGSSSQSVSIEKMRRNENDYNRVLQSLLKFYLCLGNSVECSDPKKLYIASIIARVIAGKIKIMLSFPISRKKKMELKCFNEMLHANYPDIYYHNKNKAVMLLRKSNYWAYYPACMLVRIVYSS